jgi:phospholipid/cholesterol/gamma-HCH transport system substrate-binding protein
MKKDWREREMTTEVIVGAFLLMIMLGLGYFTIILSTQRVFSDKTEMRVTFGNVMGLRDGDPVVARGMPVGKVKDLELIPECGGVCITLSLDKQIDMRADYAITIAATSILGGRQLQIKEGSLDEPAIEMTVYDGDDPYDLMEDAAAIVNEVREGLVEGHALDNMQQAMQDLSDIVTRIASGEGVIGKLLGSDTTLYDDFAATVSSARGIAAGLAEGQGTLGMLLAPDATLHKDLAATVASLRSVAGRLEKGEGTIGKLLSADETVYDDLAAMVATLRRVSDNLENGKGALPRWLNDPEVYEQVQATIDEIRGAIDDVRESAPISSFASIFFGAF